MIALLAIPACAVLYRARGAGWPEAWFGVDDRGIVKGVCLALLAWVMVLPMAVRSPVPLWEVLILSAAVIAAFFTGRAGHGEFYHDGLQYHARRLRDENQWIGWLFDWPDKVFSVWADRIGLGLTGLLFTAPAAFAAFIINSPVYGLFLIAAGGMGKPLAYALGWRVTGGQTGHGEWFFGAILGAAVAAGFLIGG